MSNIITYGQRTFTDSDITDGNVFLSQALATESLSADAFDFSVRSSVDLTDYSYGDPVTLEHDDALVGVFYVTSVYQTGVDIYTFSCTSAVGLLSKVQHLGGVYSGESAGDLIDDIFNQMGWTRGQYVVDAAIDRETVSGWLRISNCRDNLRDVLFAVGASILKNEDGLLHFTFNVPEEAAAISSMRLYADGRSRAYLAPATDVSVVEHLFYANSATEEKELYSNGTVPVDHLMVTFSEPQFGLNTGGTALTINSYGDNYAIVSGTGTLYGKAYDHTQVLISKQTGATSEKKEVTVKDCTLVSALNSINVLDRVAAYYSQAKETSYSIAYSGEKTGDLISYQGPFGGLESGYIKTLSINMSKSTLKADAVITTDWAPTNVGNNYNYFAVITTTSSGTAAGTPFTYSVPVEARGKKGRIVMLSGFCGGQGGFDGTAGEDGKPDFVGPVMKYAGGGSGYSCYYVEPGENGGIGGKGGAGGQGVKVGSHDFAALANSYQVTLGVGGQGGTNGAPGQIGGDTYFGSESTVQSPVATYYANFLSGEVYGEAGSPGIDSLTVGGKGGTAYPDGDSGDGGSLTVNGTTWKGGRGAGVAHGEGRTSTVAYQTQIAASGGGSGACYGAAGINAVRPDAPGNRPVGGAGRPGADAADKTKASLGRCGDGGDGGGGGGCGGGALSFGRNCTPGAGGRGGYGGKGGQGSDGLCILYWE